MIFFHTIIKRSFWSFFTVSKCCFKKTDFSIDPWGGPGLTFSRKMKDQKIRLFVHSLTQFFMLIPNITFVWIPKTLFLIKVYAVLMKKAKKCFSDVVCLKSFPVAIFFSLWKLYGFVAFDQGYQMSTVNFLGIFSFPTQISLAR